MVRQTSSVAYLIILCATLRAADGTTSSPLVKDPELRRELLERVKVDQDARMALIDWEKARGAQATATTRPTTHDAEHEKLSAAVAAADQANTKWLGQIVNRRGWPTISSVGTDGASAAWLLVQHADANPAFQRRVLDLMAALPKGEVSQTELAYLTDRVLLAEGKKQIYGTQFTLRDGKWQPRDLEDPEHVDQRRAEAGMMSLAEYAKALEDMYGKPSKD
jgi:hypothetical protein